MSRLLFRAFAALCFFAVAAPAFAQASPVGCWATIDDEDGTVKSYVKIYQSGNTLVGDIAKPDRQRRPVRGLRGPLQRPRAAQRAHHERLHA